ncbi:MAG: DUF2587 domain-containing protein [Acidimicrobiia bacterium]|nr:DUF2587 domain-containing protein [Acidimicrobiia bacterium]
MEEESTSPVLRPDAVEGSDAPDDPAESEPPVSEPTKIIRIASMTRAMLEEVRQAPLDEAGRRRLLEVHERSLKELAGVLSDDLQDEFNEIFRPLTSDAPTESELRVAQAQLVGWLEGLFHGIQASLMSQQMAAQAQLAEVRTRQLQSGDGEYSGGVYL